MLEFMDISVLILPTYFKKVKLRGNKSPFAQESMMSLFIPGEKIKFTLL